MGVMISPFFHEVFFILAKREFFHWGVGNFSNSATYLKKVYKHAHYEKMFESNGKSPNLKKLFLS